MQLILRGLVFTGRATNPLFDSILVEDGVIKYVGWFDNAERLARNAEVLDLGRRLITPGFIDAHCHLSLAGLYMEIGIDASSAQSIGELLELIRERARTRHEWIYVYGFSESRMREHRIPTRWELDEASSGKPVVVEHISGHYIVANTEALRRAGISRETRDPPGGLIDRDSNGEPTGILYDAAMELVLSKMPPPSRNDWLNGIKRAQYLWLRNGFTTVEDTGTFGAYREIVSAYRELRDKGQLLIRARVAYTLSDTRELDNAIREVLRDKQFDDEVLRTGLIKVFYDGSGLARTALLYDDWCRDNKPEPGRRGIRVFDPLSARRIIEKVLSSDIRLAIHAIGDKAVDEVLELIEGVTGGSRLPECIASIIHAFLVTQKGLELLRQLGICVKTQPGFIYTYGDVYAANFCTERAARAFPMKTLYRSGVVVASSTDAPFAASPNPVEGLYGAIYRRPRQGNPAFGDREALSFTEALETFTYMAARATGWDDLVGEIKPGKRADIVVWSIESTNPSAEELLSMRPLLVLRDGEIVYKSSFLGIG